MTKGQVRLALGVALAALAAPAAAQGFSDGVVKIGILNDQSGTYAEFGGRSSVEAARMAVEDFGGKINGRRSRSSRPTTRTSPTSPPASRGNGTTATTSTRSWS